MQAAHSGLFEFSTDRIAPQERIAALRDVLGRVYLGADFMPLSDTAPRVTARQFSCGSVRLTVAESDACGLVRGPQFLADGDIDFRFVLPEGIPFEFESVHRVERMNAGEAMVVFHGEAGTARYLGPSRGFAMRIGHRLLLDAMPGLKLQPMWRIAAGSPALRLLAVYLRCLHRELPGNDRLLDICIERHLVELVALALSPAREMQVPAGRALKAARLAAIRADVLANLGETGLSAKTVAHRHGVSDRYVHRLFEQTGETFCTFVEGERIRRAFALLTDPKLAGMPIGEVARAVGYSEHSTFNRAFRRRFGDAPSAVQRVHRRQNGPVN